jgi:hypothetical protein
MRKNQEQRDLCLVWPSCPHPGHGTQPPRQLSTAKHRSETPVLLIRICVNLPDPAPPQPPLSWIRIIRDEYFLGLVVRWSIHLMAKNVYIKLRLIWRMQLGKFNSKASLKKKRKVGPCSKSTSASKRKMLCGLYDETSHKLFYLNYCVGTRIVCPVGNQIICTGWPYTQYCTAVGYFFLHSTANFSGPSRTVRQVRTNTNSELEKSLCSGLIGLCISQWHK